MINEKRLIENFIRLTAIDAESGEEAEMRAYLIGALARLGISPETDETGNLFARIPGTVAGEPLLFSAHMDTVCPGRGKKAVIHTDGRITSDGTTVLGADDDSGIAAILEALTVIRENALPHPDIELLFTVDEERFCLGSVRFDYTKLRAKTAYILDLAAPVGSAAIAAPTLLSLEITISGRASHAGFEPEKGVNALSIAAGVLARLKTGHIAPDTTVNFGTIEGGTGQNIVPALICISGEVRSMCHETAMNEASSIAEAFRKAAEKAGGSARVVVEERIHAYRISEDEPVISHFRAAMSALGWGEPTLVETFGGSDNNQFVSHGLRGVVLASPMTRAHTTEEYAEVSELVKSAELVLKLMTMENIA